MKNVEQGTNVLGIERLKQNSLRIAIRVGMGGICIRIPVSITRKYVVYPSTLISCFPLNIYI